MNRMPRKSLLTLISIYPKGSDDVQSEIEIHRATPNTAESYQKRLGRSRFKIYILR